MFSVVVFTVISLDGSIAAAAEELDGQQEDVEDVEEMSAAMPMA